MSREFSLTRGLLALSLVLSLTGCVGTGPSPGASTSPDRNRSGQAHGINMRECETYVGPDEKKLSKTEKLATVHMQLGLSYLQEDALEAAQRSLDKALALDPKLPRVYAGKALLLLRMGQMESAGELYEKAFRLAPGDPEINSNYGLYLCSKQQFDQADAHFRCAIANPIYATPGLAYHYAGRCALSAERTDQAILDLKTAAVLMPNSAATRLLLADAYYRQGDNQQAVNAYEQFLQNGERTPSALWLGIQIYRTTQNLNKIASFSMLLRNKFPDSKEAGYLEQQ